MNPLNNIEQTEFNFKEELIEPRPLSPYNMLVGLIAKKIGKNGILEFNFSDKDLPKSVNINIKNNKVFIYAE